MFFCTLTATATSFGQRDSPSLTAGTCAVGEIQNDDDDGNQGDAGAAHHPRLRDVTRPFGLEARHGGDRDDYDDDRKPSQPCHAGQHTRSDCRRIV